MLRSLAGSTRRQLITEMIDRKAKLLNHIKPSSQDGLEIGPLATPTLTKSECGGRIKYIDHATTGELREKYRHNAFVKIEDIVDVDFLWGQKTLSEAVSCTRFDYVIASHVIEHVPDMIGWLNEIAEILKEHGILSLAIPDKRFTFDILREISTPGQFIEDFILHRRHPSPQATFDHVAKYVTIDIKDVWDGKVSIRNLVHANTLQQAYQLVEDSLVADQYYDVHVSIFTPASFLDLVKIFCQLDLLVFLVKDFYDTVRYTNEFIISLERLPRDIDRNEKLALQLDSISRAQQRLP
jgi:predicted SAM-dependent methyltransferase